LKDIIKKMDDPPSERTVRNDLSVLKNLNIVSNIGFGRSSKWVLENNKEIIRK